jgi:hypothetical protein
MTDEQLAKPIPEIAVAETYPIEGFWQTRYNMQALGGGEVSAIAAGHTENESRSRAEHIVQLESRVRELEQALTRIEGLPYRDQDGNNTGQIYARDIALAALHVTDKAAKQHA